MDKIVFNILDDVFSHDKYSVAGRESEFIYWDRELKNKSLPTFYSHNKIPSITQNITPKENSYGWIFESRAIIPAVYSGVEPFIPNFNKVFTHSSVLLEKFPNCHWIPGGGIWIGGTYGKGEIKIFEKTKLCSMVSSYKTMCDLHRQRLNVASFLHRNSNVDVFGLDRWVPINETLEPYMFSIVVENFQDELYFTEKLLNCFATGTIPIYLGAKNINQKFNIDGIIQINSLLELNQILPTLSKELYESKRASIEDNFERCLQYKSLEDYIFKNYFTNE
jgi:hypothetical protein